MPTVTREPHVPPSCLAAVRDDNGQGAQRAVLYPRGARSLSPLSQDPEDRTQMNEEVAAVFGNDDMISTILSFLRLESLRHTLGVNWTFHKFTRSRLTEQILPCLVPLTSPPFNLVLARMPSSQDVDSEAYGDEHTLGEEGISTFVRALSTGCFENVKRLWLADNDIGAAGMADLSSVFAYLPQLQVLDVAGNNIGGPGVVALARAFRIGSLPNLQLLWLGENLIDDTGCVALADALSNKPLIHLEGLNIQANRIGEEGLEALAGALNNEFLNLKYLYVDDGHLGSEHATLKAACDARNIHLLCWA